MLSVYDPRTIVMVTCKKENHQRKSSDPPATLPALFFTGFARKEFRGKLAIAITANFVNRNTTAEAKVEEISGVAFIFNQKFFLELKEETGEFGTNAEAKESHSMPH